MVYGVGSSWDTAAAAREHRRVLAPRLPTPLHKRNLSGTSGRAASFAPPRAGSGGVRNGSRCWSAERMTTSLTLSFLWSIVPNNLSLSLLKRCCTYRPSDIYLMVSKLPSLSLSLSLSGCHMLGPERPEAVLPDKALNFSTFSHLLIVDKTSLCVYRLCVSRSFISEFRGHRRMSNTGFGYDYYHSISLSLSLSLSVSLISLSLSLCLSDLLLLLLLQPPREYF